MLIEKIDVLAELAKINRATPDSVGRLKAYGALAKRMNARNELARREAALPSATPSVPTRKAVSAIATVQARVNELRQKKPGLSAVEALDQVLTSDPQLYARYRTEMEEARVGKSEGRQRFEGILKAAIAKGEGATTTDAFTAAYAEYCGTFRPRR